MPIDISPSPSTALDDYSSTPEALPCEEDVWQHGTFLPLQEVWPGEDDPRHHTAFSSTPEVVPWEEDPWLHGAAALVNIHLAPTSPTEAGDTLAEQLAEYEAADQQLWASRLEWAQELAHRATPPPPSPSLWPSGDDYVPWDINVMSREAEELEAENCLCRAAEDADRAAYRELEDGGRLDQYERLVDFQELVACYLQEVLRLPQQEYTAYYNELVVWADDHAAYLLMRASVAAWLLVKPPQPTPTPTPVPPPPPRGPVSASPGSSSSPSLTATHLDLPPNHNLQGGHDDDDWVDDAQAWPSAQDDLETEDWQQLLRDGIVAQPNLSNSSAEPPAPPSAVPKDDLHQLCSLVPFDVEELPRWVLYARFSDMAGRPKRSELSARLTSHSRLQASPALRLPYM